MLLNSKTSDTTLSLMLNSAHTQGTKDLANGKTYLKQSTLSTVHSTQDEFETVRKEKDDYLARRLDDVANNLEKCTGLKVSIRFFVALLEFQMETENLTPGVRNFYRLARV